MDNQSADTEPSRKLSGHIWPWVVVLLVLLFIGFIRFRLLDMPLERDEGEYAYAGQLILQGIPPYELAYNMKLPGTYFAYAAGMAVFGQTAAGVHLTLIVVNSLTIIFVFLLARKLFGVVAGLAACAGYGVMSISPHALGLAAHANHFVVLFAVLATLLLLAAVEDKSNRLLAISGLLYGLAFLMKQQGIFFILFGGTFLLWQAARDKSVFTKDFLKKGLVFAGGVFLPFAMFCFACFVAGDFPRFWFWTFQYARWYADSKPFAEGVQLLERHLHLVFYVSCGFWALTAIGLLLAFFNKKFRGPAIFVLVFWLFSFFGTATGYYFRGHYFILVLPAFAILVGMAVAVMQDYMRFPFLQDAFRSLPVILFGLIFTWMVMYQSQFFFLLSPRQVIQSIYQLSPFEEAQVVGDYLRENSALDAKIAVVGSEPEIYFYAHRHSATGYIYTYPLMESQPDALQMQHDMAGEIETNRPEYVVMVYSGLSWLPGPHSDPFILNWADQYVGRDYDQIGIVHNDQGKIESLWGDAVKNTHLKGDGLVVYRRKPNAD